MNKKEYYSLKEISRMAKCSYANIYNANRYGVLEHVKSVAGISFVPAEHLDSTLATLRDRARKHPK